MSHTIEWIRTGECNRCGECCKVIDMIGKKFGTCSLYAQEANGLGCCTDRNHPYYLKVCSTWPYRPDQIGWNHKTQMPERFPSCSYKFSKAIPIHAQPTQTS